MQISKINNQNFGANPSETTKMVLVGLERKGIDTTSIIRKMLNLSPKGIVQTHRFSTSGVCRMDVFSASGTNPRSIISTKDAIHLDENFAPLLPEKAYAKIDKGLDAILAKRSADEKIWDKIERLCIQG